MPKIVDLNYTRSQTDIDTEEFKQVLQNQVHKPRDMSRATGKDLSLHNPLIRSGMKEPKISDKKKKEYKHYQDYGKNMSEHYKSMPLQKKVGKGKGSLVPVNRDIFKPVDNTVKHPTPFRDSNPAYQNTVALNKKIRASKAYSKTKKNVGDFQKNPLNVKPRGMFKDGNDSKRNYVTDRMSPSQRAEARTEVVNNTNKAFTEHLNGRHPGSVRPNLSVRKIGSQVNSPFNPTTNASNLMTLSQKVGIMQNAGSHKMDAKYQSEFNGNVTLKEMTANRGKLNIQRINGIGGNATQGPLAHPEKLLSASQKGSILGNMGLLPKENILDPLVNGFKNFARGLDPGAAETARIWGGMAHTSGVDGYTPRLGNVQNLNPKELEHFKRGIRNDASKHVRTLGENVDPFFKTPTLGEGVKPNFQHRKTFTPSEGVSGYGLGVGNVMAASRAELGSRGLAFLTGRGGMESLMNSVGVMTSIQKSQMKSRTNFFAKAITPGFMAVGGAYTSFMYTALTGGDVSDFAENQLSYAAGLQGWRVGSSFGGMLASPVDNKGFKFVKEGTVKESAKTNLNQLKQVAKGNLLRGTTTLLGGATGALIGAGLVAGTSAFVKDITSNTSVIRKMAKDLHNSTMYMNTASNNKTLTARSAALNKLAKSGLNDRAMLLGNEARILKGYM